MKNYEGFKGKSLPLRDVMWWAVFEVWLDPDKNYFYDRFEWARWMPD